MSLFCFVCGQTGAKSTYYGTHDSEKLASEFLRKASDSICDVVIYRGTHGHYEEIPCCSNCFKIGKRWSHKGTGFCKSTDFDYNVRKYISHTATIKYLRHLPEGDLGDMGRVTKVEYLRKTKNSGIVSYNYIFTLVKRQMRDGKWVQVPKPAGELISDWESIKEEVKPEYTQARLILEEFNGASHTPLKPGMVLINGNTRVDWKGITRRTFERVRLIEATGESDSNGLPIWIAEAYDNVRERSAQVLQKWWRAEYSKYYGPKRNGMKLAPRNLKTPRLRAFQRTTECKLCGGFTTNDRIQQEGAECKVCTGWTIDERYCRVCDCELAGERTTGCPGCQN